MSLTWSNDVTAKDEKEIRRGIRVSGQDGRNAEEIYYQDKLKLVEPTLLGKKARIADYVQAYRQLFLTDERLFPSELEASVDDEGVVHLRGQVLFQENSNVLENIFRHLGFQKIANNISIAPNSELGGKCFALVKTPVGCLYSAPEGTREKINQCLYGDAVYLIKASASNNYLVLTMEGYGGYMEASSLELMDAETFHAYQEGPRGIVQCNLALDGVSIPMGSTLKLLEVANDADTVELPSGRKEQLTEAQVAVVKQNTVLIDQVLKSVESYLGTVYHWGGRSSAGIDCSGLIQSSFQTHGIILPRDASQQVAVGKVSATRWYPQGIGRGDTLYFANATGRITHTAIAISRDDFIEADETVRLSSFNPNSDHYLEKRAKSFVFAKRILV